LSNPGLPRAIRLVQIVPVLVHTVAAACFGRCLTRPHVSRLGLPTDTTAADQARATVTLRGPVAVAADGRPSFTLTSTAPLDRLTIGRPGQEPLTLSGAVVTLRSGPAGAFVARGALAGLATEATPDAEVELPNAWAGTLAVRVGGDAAFPAFATVGAALAVAGTPAPVLTALRTLPALADLVTAPVHARDVSVRSRRTLDVGRSSPDG
jgi:hypothetical protein